MAPFYANKKTVWKENVFILTYRIFSGIRIRNKSYVFRRNMLHIKLVTKAEERERPTYGETSLREWEGEIPGITVSAPAPSWRKYSCRQKIYRTVWVSIKNNTTLQKFLKCPVVDFTLVCPQCPNRQFQRSGTTGQHKRFKTAEFLLNLFFEYVS